ncbi:MAG: hypothetical protein KF819_13415 [Labilithrix sp.]|nr:hypothetical protein [Labilithrix sp.]
MKLASHTRALLIVLPFVALPALSLVASCAGAEDQPPGADDASAVITSDAGDAPPDDAALEGPTCASADFCPVSVGVDPRYALTSIWGSSATDVWAVGSGGTVVHYDGATWRLAATGIVETLHAVWGSGPTDVWVVSSASVLLHSKGAAGGAISFTSVPAASPDAYGGRAHAAWGSSATDVIVGGAVFDELDLDTGASRSGNYLRLQPAGDGGAPAWKAFEGDDGAWTRATVRAIWGSSASDVWMSADNSPEIAWMRGLLLHRTPGDGGAPGAWTSVDSQSAHVLASIWGSSANDVWAVGSLGTIRHWAAGATRWAITPSPTSADLHGVWGSGPSDVWAVGDEGTILHYDGKTWATATAAFALGPKPDLHGVWGSGPNDVWVVGDGVVLRFTGPKTGGDR